MLLRLGSAYSTSSSHLHTQQRLPGLPEPAFGGVQLTLQPVLGALETGDEALSRAQTLLPLSNQVLEAGDLQGNRARNSPRGSGRHHPLQRAC